MWNFKMEDYIFDPAGGEAGYGLDIHQRICRDYLVTKAGSESRNLIRILQTEPQVSRSEAFFHFLGWYATCIKECHDIGCNIGENGNTKKQIPMKS